MKTLAAQNFTLKHILTVVLLFITCSSFGLNFVKPKSSHEDDQLRYLGSELEATVQVRRTLGNLLIAEELKAPPCDILFSIYQQNAIPYIPTEPLSLVHLVFMLESSNSVGPRAPPASLG